MYLIRQAFHRHSARRQINLANALGYNGFDLGIEKPKALGATALSRSQRVNGANRFVSANQAIKRGLAYPEIPSDVLDVREPKRPLMTIQQLTDRLMSPYPLAPCRRLLRRFKLDLFVAHVASRSSQTFQLKIIR